MSEWIFPTGDHLSPSQIGDYLRCPLCFKWSRIDREPYPLHVSLPIGGSIHRAVETWRRRILNEHDDSFDGILDVVSEAFDSSLNKDPETDTEIKLDLGEYATIGEAKDEAVRITRNTMPWIRDLDLKRGLIGVEAPLHKLVNEDPWPFRIWAYADALYGNDQAYTTGSDLKTARSQKAPDFYAALQAGIYSHFLMGLPWLIDVVPKTKSPNPRTYTCQFTSENLRFTHELVMEVAGRIRDGDFPARPGYTCKFAHGDPEFKLAVDGFGD
jgi:hypothetical protein